MAGLRTDIWVAAFVRRHNDLGHICVIARKGDPLAGQVFIEVDHLDGTASLYAPAASDILAETSGERRFALRFDHAEPIRIRERLDQEERFDPDYWLVSLDLRRGDPGIEVADG